MNLEKRRKLEETDPENSDKELFRDLIRQLLRPHKTIRDSVHKDIYVTHLETLILDTLDFQRLRRLKQLGLTNLVFPSANHTRLEHSLGTLYMSDTMIEKINKNPYARFKIGHVDRFIIRLCALLHDLGNIPYGHTLEDEGGLFGPQWSDERLKRFLGDESKIGKVILDFETLQALAILKCDRLAPGNVLKEVRQTLKFIELKKPQDLERPYIADIVGNTLCADLLDYTRRDPYFTGISGSYDDRVLSYLYITKVNGKKRLVLRLTKPSTEEIRHDVLSEFMDLLRLRYSLAEKVYYHHTKIIASAMLISAVNSMVQENRLSEESLFDMDDSLLLNHLSVNGTQIAKHLADHLLERKLYKIAYDLSYSGEGIAQTETQKKDKIIADLKDPESRYKMERTLEMMNSNSATVQSNPGSIVIYCPEKKMGLKEIETLVDYGKKISPLKNIEDPRIEGEIETSISAKHRELWRMYVIVDPDIPDIERSYINGDCQQLLGLPSASEKYRAASHTHYVDRYVDKWHSENPKSTPLLATEVKEIKAELTTRGDSPDKILSFSQFCGQIADIRAPKKA